MEKIVVKYFGNVGELEQTDYGDWIDLRASEDIVMKQGEYKAIPLNVAMKLPKGYEALVVPRSSTYKNFGIIQANSIGVIDNSYCGDGDQWHFLAIAMRDTEIKAGDRICQFRIMKNQPRLKFRKVSKLEDINRGGIGSTGVK